MSAFRFPTNLNSNGASASAPQLEWVASIVSLFRSLNEIARAAIEEVESNAARERSKGRYSEESALRDQRFIAFFKSWPEAETRYWLGGEAVGDPFLASFSREFPWFVEGDLRTPFSVRTFLSRERSE